MTCHFLDGWHVDVCRAKSKQHYVMRWPSGAFQGIVTNEEEVKSVAFGDGVVHHTAWPRIAILVNKRSRPLHGCWWVEPSMVSLDSADQNYSRSEVGGIGLKNSLLDPREFDVQACPDELFFCKSIAIDDDRCR